MGAYADHSKGKQGLKLFQQMQREAVLGNNSTMRNMLSVCISEGDLLAGRQIHVTISSSVLESDVVVASALVNMYGKVGSLDDSQKIFHNMNLHNVVVWSCMIFLYVNSHKYKDALQSFESMLQEGVLPNSFTFVSIMCACACRTLAKVAKTIHARLVGSKLEQHPYVVNAITNMYGRCGDLKEAESNFSAASKQGTTSWNTILAAYAYYGRYRDAIKLISRMLEAKIIPDATTFINLLSACANQKALVEGMDIHTYITLMGLEMDRAVSNTLLNLYGKCNCLNAAKHLLKEMPEHDVVSWNTLITGYSHHSLGIEAFCMFQQMIQEGILPNLITYTCILDGFVSENLLAAGKQIHTCVISEMNVAATAALMIMYGRCGCFQRALQVFHSKTVPSVLLWNAVFAVCNQHEHGDEALDLFFQMHKEEIILDSFTYSNILSSCTSQGALSTGKEVHALAVENEFAKDMVVATALINMYGKCGSLADAMGVFETTHNRDIVFWTSIIHVFSQHGKGRETIQLLRRMQKGGFVPNDITYLSALSACSHSGLLNEARQCFTSMQQDYGIVPTGEHYICMIDLLARSGLLEEAEKLITGMPFQAGFVSWTILLGACKNENDLERGERIGKLMINLYPDKAPPYVALFQIYAATGREDEAEAILGQMRERGIKKETERESDDELLESSSNQHFSSQK
ncbi:hypothetical protein L7F22_057201 [Adiantum nelumboides]|nr:hypothetical protein [Adiantum nelumboides]